MEEKINLIISQLGDLRIKKDVDLGEYVLSKPAGFASALYIATSVIELCNAVLLCRELKVPFLVLGSGSKITSVTSGFIGLVIKNRSQNLKIFGIKGKVSKSGIGIEEAFIETDSGTTLADLADFAFKQGLAGFEDLKLIKGTVGGSVLSESILFENVSQLKVLNSSNIEQSKNKGEVFVHDVILKAVFHLKAREV